jgi:OFA family oxalate/formate antiporter-like MFS transporter
MYITGNISPYISIYFGVTTTATSNILVEIICLTVLFLPFGTWLIQKHINPKLIIGCGGMFSLLLMLIATYCESYQAFHWFYVLSFSSAVGLLQYCANEHAWLFFPDKKGLASGIVLSGFGLGAFIFINISTKIINPNNIP